MAEASPPAHLLWAISPPLLCQVQGQVLPRVPPEWDLAQMSQTSLCHTLLGLTSLGVLCPARSSGTREPQSKVWAGPEQHPGPSRALSCYGETENEQNQ